jgi:hypothetical protein
MRATGSSIRVQRLELPFVTPFRNAKVRCHTLSYLWVDVTGRKITGRGENTAMPSIQAKRLLP